MAQSLIQSKKQGSKNEGSIYVCAGMCVCVLKIGDVGKIRGVNKILPTL